MTKEERKKYVLAQLNSLPNAFQYIEVANYIDLLEQENQQLKNNINQIKNNNEELKERIKSIQEKRDSYKFRYKDVCKKIKQRDEVIDKAIKFIKEETDSMSAGLGIKKSIHTYKLLDILRKYKGVSNE